MIADIQKKLEKDRKVIVNELKRDFTFIEGAADAKAWRFERNLNKMLVRPAQTIASCQKICVDLLDQNADFWKYYEKFQRLKSQTRNKPLEEPVGLYGYDQQKEATGKLSSGE